MKKLLQQSAQRKEQEIQSINNVAENTTPAPEKPVKEMVEEKSVEEKPVQEVTEKTALKAEAEALGIAVDGRWGVARLQAEIAAKKSAG